MSRRRPRKPSAPLPAAIAADAASQPHSPPAPAARSFTLSECLLPALLFVWTFLSLIFPLYDTDFWWHLRTGEWILAEGRVPQIDLYTFTDADRPWIDLHWGFQILVTWLYRLGGANLIILAKAAVITCAVAITFFSTGQGWSWERRVLCWIPAVICISGRGYERPEFLSQLFLALWLWIVFRLEQTPRLVWFLPAIQLVWVNCHALFILGLVIAGCGILDWIIRGLLGGQFGLSALSADELRSLRTRVFAGLAAVCASLCNPYFEEGALFPFTLYQKFSSEQGFYSLFVGEFRKPIQFLQMAGVSAFRNIYFVSEIIVALVAAASVIARLRAGLGLNLFRLLLLAAFGHLAWEATRNTNLFALVATSVACANFAEARLARTAAAPSRGGQKFVLAAVLTALCVAVVTGTWNRLAGDGNKPFGLGEARDWYIHEAAKFAGRDGMPELAIVNNFGQAAVYIYHNSPERHVFMDGRLEVCSKETFKMLFEILRWMSLGKRDWEGIFRAAKVPLPVVILDTRHSGFELLGMLQTPGWRLVYADATAGVFLEEAKADELNLEPADEQVLREQLKPYIEERERRARR